MREDNRKKNSGFTLVEVLVAVAILAVVSIPIIQSFVSVAQVNGKSRRRMVATTVAESLMESCKSMSLVEFAAQCDGLGIPVTCIASETTVTATEITAAGTLSVKKTASQTTTKVLKFDKTAGYTVTVNGIDRKRHSFKFENIGASGNSYDAVVHYTESARNRSEESLGGSKTVRSVLTGEGIRVMKFYDVEISVYRHGYTTPICVITGSVTDYNE